LRVTLVIGIIASMFSALIVTRNLFAWALHKNWVKKITMANLIPVTNFDFMGTRRLALAFSMTVILGSMAVFAFRGEKTSAWISRAVIGWCCSRASLKIARISQGPERAQGDRLC
jgi:preprotein translocase subunit SecF